MWKFSSFRQYSPTVTKFNNRRLQWIGDNTVTSDYLHSLIQVI